MRSGGSASMSCLRKSNRMARLWSEEELEEAEVTQLARIRLWNQVSDFGLLSQGQEKPVKGFEQI